jgi:penicillin G amidase
VVTVIPSMRIVMPTGDFDGTRIVAPMGQSGQPGHPHFGDMVDRWLLGETVPLTFNRATLENDDRVQELILLPQTR